MKQFSLPDLKNKNVAFATYYLNKKSYNFRFEWCEDFVLVDIKFMLDGNEKYLLQGFPVVANYNLIERIKTPEIITGNLYIKHKYEQDVPITRNNFDSDFVVVYEEIKGEQK